MVGVRLWEVASLSPRSHGVHEIALPYLEDLFEVTRHHVLPAARDNEEAVLIERLSAKDATEVTYPAGGHAPLRSTAVGLVLLAGADQQFQETNLAEDPENEPGGAAMPEGQGSVPEPGAPGGRQPGRADPLQGLNRSNPYFGQTIHNG